MELNTSYNYSDQYVHKKFDKRKRSHSEIESSNDEEYKPLNLTINNNSLCNSPNSIICNDENHNNTTLSTDGRLFSNDEIKEKKIINQKHSKTSPSSKYRRIVHSIKEEDAINLLQMPQETLLKICKYHPNMARHTIKKERAPKDQERRNKNTIACRKTRRVKKLQEIAQNEDYKNCYQEYFQLLRENSRTGYYIKELIKLINKDFNL